jgi:hypothetical protein
MRYAVSTRCRRQLMYMEVVDDDCGARIEQERLARIVRARVKELLLIHFHTSSYLVTSAYTSELALSI